MNATRRLHELGQSLWLDNITRGMLADGTLRRYRDELSITGLTSNPTIFDHAIASSTAYDDAIRRKTREGRTGERLFVELALEDLTEAAELFRPVHRQTGGVDGWVSLEVSPLLAYDTASTLAEARALAERAARPNIFIKIPGTPEGVPAIEEAIAAGVPINVTLLFSPGQYRAVAEAYFRGIERRLAAGLDPRVRSVASLFVSRWDRAVAGRVPEALQNQLGLAIARQTYRVYRELLASSRWSGLAARGALPQRLLWASTGTKDPKAPDVLYLEALAAPDTIITIPDATLLAFADHGKVGDVLPVDGGDADAVVAAFGQAGVDVAALGETLQRDGASAFVASWKDLMERIAAKAEALRRTA
jgi:transaldolase